VELLEAQTAGRPSTANALARIQRAVGEMTEFTDALLTLSREEHAASEAECEVQELLMRIVDDLRNETPDKRITVDIEAQDTVRVAAPETMVAMLIGNIVRNAVQHGTSGDVRCRLQGRELSVVNAGALPETDLGQSTSRRFTTHPRGHGMGLYLVRRICERYRWGIRLENTAEGVLATVGF
jgi:signal transduction histidine kinase